MIRVTIFLKDSPETQQFETPMIRKPQTAVTGKTPQFEKNMLFYIPFNLAGESL